MKKIVYYSNYLDHFIDIKNLSYIADHVTYIKWSEQQSQNLLEVVRFVNKLFGIWRKTLKRSCSNWICKVCNCCRSAILFFIADSITTPYDHVHCTAAKDSFFWDPSQHMSSCCFRPKTRPLIDFLTWLGIWR